MFHTQSKSSENTQAIFVLLISRFTGQNNSFEQVKELFSKYKITIIALNELQTLDMYHYVRDWI